MPFFFDHYPYTNFHNVNLDWVLQAVKAWGALVEENNIKFHNLEEAMTSFRNTLLGEWGDFQDETQNEINQFELWTQNYLQNLNVQDEINTKLDSMLASGVLSPYFAPYIQTDVSDWLQHNITPTSPAIDASLTISGAGADAKVTGDYIRDLNSKTETVIKINGYVSTVEFTSGGYINNTADNISSSINNPVSNNNWLYSVVQCVEGEQYIISGNSGTDPKAYVITDANYNVIKRNNSVNFTGEIIIPENGAYLVINRIKANLRDSYKWTDIIKNNTDDINDCQNNINYIYSLDGIEGIINFIDGFYVDTSVSNISSSINSPSESSAWSYAVLNCTSGDKFYIDTNSGTRPKCYAFADANYNVLESGNAIHFVGTITAPLNSAYLVLNKSSSNTNKSYIGENKIEKNRIDIVENENKLAYYNQNLIIPDKNNTIWSWWTYPQAISFNRIRNQLYFSFTNSDGFIGIASYDIKTGRTIKNLLRKSSQPDDHNACAIYIFDDGVILVAYASGHGEDRYIRIRKSTTAECIERFSSELLLESNGTTTYSQLFYYNNKLYLFYRSNAVNWCYRYSSDRGDTWSAEITLITSDIQYYCKFAETSTDGVLRLCCYSNPSLSDANIRQAFLHLDSGELYNSDNSTILGVSNVSKNNIDIIISIDSNYQSQRLFDVAKTDINRPLILYAPYTGGNSIYRLYDTGTIYDIVVGGTPLISTYLLGASFIGTSKIIASHGSGGSDVIDIYTYADNNITHDKTVWSETRGMIPIRNARPITDINLKYCLWQRGYYGSGYSSFNTDALIYDIIDDDII